MPPTRKLLFQLQVPIACIILLMGTALHAQQAPPSEKPAALPDTVTFTNGDQLSGRLLRIVAGTLTFHSDIVGDVTAPLAKVRTLHSAQPFAVVTKTLIDNPEHLRRRLLGQKVPLGALEFRDTVLEVSQLAPAATTPAPPPHKFNAKEVEFVIDAADFRRELRGEHDLLYGWNGTITVGAGLVNGTNSDQTYTGAVAFQRTIPAIPYMPPFSKYMLNLNGSYGLLTQPEIISGATIIQSASSAKTDILHGDTEYDRYLSPRVFALANASADHNYGSGLQLQQSFGLGFGWTIVKTPKQELDLKADGHYEQQRFYNGTVSGLGTPDENLFGADLSETWMRTFTHNIKFSEYVTLTPAFNVVRAYSGVANATLVFPVYKRFSLSVASTDNYLGDPPVGYKRNTFQFTSGITFALK